MKNTLSTRLVAVAALLAGAATAGDQPRSDEMRSDADGDGRVSRAEATTAGAQRSGEWFDKLDLDRDGYVTQEEMKQARETRRENMRADRTQKLAEHFKAADANSDGQLSLDEVQTKMPRMAERFTEIDKDKNGLLSKEELQRGPRHGGQPQPQS